MVAHAGEKGEPIQELLDRPVAPGYIQIIQNFPPAFVRDPNASIVIGRTMFETDRLPVEYVRACNMMDYIWVPSEFNRATFARSGVAREKLVVIPGCLDIEPYARVARARSEATSSLSSLDSGTPDSHRDFTFLTCFDWTLHKGWDVLITSFLRAFEGCESRTDVRLIVKTWSTHGHSNEQIIEQAARHVYEKLGTDLRADNRIQFMFERLTSEGMIDLYRSVDAFVMPSRGEGWGRPFMESMICQLPVVGTNWSGNTAFMGDANSYLLNYKLVPVPEIGWREVPPYQGGQWAEPDSDHLVETLRHIVDNRDEARAKGALASREICEKYSLQAVGKLIKAELAGFTALTGASP